MIRFEYMGGEYGLTFAHPEYSPEELRGWGVEVEGNRRCTVAMITNVHTNAAVACDIAVCHPYDTFTRDRGRHTALTNALRLTPSKAFRRAVWEAYRGR